MSKENVKKFLTELPNDTNLQNKLRNLNKKYANRSDLGLAEKFKIIENEYLRVIRESGYEFTLKELNEYKSTETEHEIIEDELETVAGGKKRSIVAEFTRLYNPEYLCNFIFDISEKKY